MAMTDCMMDQLHNVMHSMGNNLAMQQITVSGMSIRHARVTIQIYMNKNFFSPCETSIGAGKSWLQMGVKPMPLAF